MKRIFNALISRWQVLFFSRWGCLFGSNVKIRNTGIIRGKKGSSIGAIRNQTTSLFSNPVSVVINSGFLSLGSNARIHKGAKISNSGHIEIGSDTYINPCSLIIVKNSLKIGDNCAISWNVSIMDDDLHRLNTKIDQSKGIYIGDHVWIGSDVKILKNVSIGSGSVIAANSLVNSDVPENCLAAGIPARVVKTNIQWD